MPELFMHEKFPKYFFAGLTMIALGLVAVGAFTAKAIKDAKRANDVITVTGSARKTIRSDYGTWSVNVSCLSETIQGAYDCANNRGARVRRFLAEHKAADSSITLGGIQQQSIFHSRNGEFLGYSCSQTIDVRTTLVDSLDKWSKEIASLIPEVVDLRSNPPQYFFTKLAELRVAMLSEATLDAKTRAEMIAESAGGKIAAIRNAKMGVFQITAPNSRDMRDAGTYDTSTIEKDITAVVSASFSVE